MLNAFLLWFSRLGKAPDVAPDVPIIGRWLSGNPSEYLLSGVDSPLELAAITVAPTLSEWET